MASPTEPSAAIDLAPLAVDFLPVRYRHRRQKEQAQLWRIVVVFCYVLLLLTATVHLRRAARHTAAELAAAQAQRQQAAERQLELGRLENRLRAARATARLYTCLRQDWSATRVIDAVLAELPAGIVLDEIELRREAAGSGTPMPAAGGSREEQEQAARLKLPAERELDRHRAACDPLRLLIVLQGRAELGTDLYPYLERLRGLGPVEKAELVSLEAQAEGQGGSRFQARLVLRPAHGQGGGPARQAEAPAIAAAG